MMCFRPKRSRSKSTSLSPAKTFSEKKNEILVRIPECRVDLMDEGDALEVGAGDLEVLRIWDENVCIATTIKVGDELQWPLTKDEPVVKLDALHYLFSLPIKDEKPLSYGVAFSHKNSSNLGLLDSFLKENSLFTTPATARRKEYHIDWKEFAPAVDDYNNVLAKAIAGGSGQIVKGIFKCTNAYTNQVQKGGETMLIRAADLKEKNSKESNDANKKRGSGSGSGSVNKSLKRVRKVSKMTEKISKAMVDVVGVASGSVMAPVLRSQAGKTILSTLPGEVLLASLDSLNKILDAAEAAEKQAMTATSGAVTRMVSNRFGESAGETTEDALTTVGHCAGTAWNVVKLRKAINPASGLRNTAARP